LWSGTAPQANPKGTDGPFASISQARAAIAGLRASGQVGDISIVIRGGRYYLDDSVVQGIDEDEALERDRTEYRTYPGEEAIFSAGSHVRGWRHRQDWYLTLYLPPEEPTKRHLDDTSSKRIG
jgi:hypothetical protein